MMKTYQVYGGGLATYLQGAGFEIKAIIPSNRDKNKKIFLFDESEELLAAVKRYEESKIQALKNVCRPPLENNSIVVDQLKNIAWCMNENAAIILDALERINKNLEDKK